MGNDGDGVAAAPPEGMGGGSKHRLRVQRRLGQGAYGMVYKGEPPGNGTAAGQACYVLQKLLGSRADIHRHGCNICVLYCCCCGYVAVLSLCTGTYDGAVCAVKTVLRGNDAAGELAYRMFIREAQMLQSCAHRCARAGYDGAWDGHDRWGRVATDCSAAAAAEAAPPAAARAPSKAS